MGRQRVAKVTEEMEGAIRVLHSRGEDPKSIARHLGLGYSTVLMRLQRQAPDRQIQAKTAVDPEGGTNSRFPILARLQAAERRVADLLRAADLLQASAPDEAARLCELAQATEPEPLTETEKEYLTYAETFR